MIKNKPPSLARQLDRCDVCGTKIHRDKLVRTQVAFLRPRAENYLSYSSYDGTYWVMDTATDEGSISYGNHCDNARLVINSDNTIGYLNCVQTWSGNGVMRMETASPASALTAQLVFSAMVGPHEQNTSPEMTVVLGICNSDGSVKSAVRSWTIKSATRVWFSELASTLSATGLGTGSPATQFYYYIQVTNAGKWWIDEIQLEANTDFNTPENFVKTEGTYVSNQTDQPLMSSRKVCPECFEYVLKKSTQYGRTKEKPVASPVDPYMQEI